MLPRCDVVVLSAPLTAETRHLIDRAAISAMKPTAYFINVGRGASVDEAALAQALGGAPDRRRGHRRVRHGAAAGFRPAVLLALAHRVPRMLEWHARETWPPDADRWDLFVPTEVRGATLGVIGYGSIGRELARIATSAFGMTVLACKRDPGTRADPGYGLPGTGDPDGTLPAEWYGPADLPRMLPRCDVVVLSAPLTAETRHLDRPGRRSPR